MSNPSQGYKLPESVPGAGESGISGQNTNQEALANGGRQPQTLNEEVGQTLPSNFTLANTKAETKGEDHLITNPETGDPREKVRAPVNSHDIDMPEHAPSQAMQSNETSKVPHSADTGKPQV